MNRIFIITTIVFLSASMLSNAQDYPRIWYLTDVQCYGESDDYSAITRGNCSYYKWQVTNGKITHVNNIPQPAPVTYVEGLNYDDITVKWNETDNGINGTLKLTVGQCIDYSGDAGNANLTVKLRSVKNLTLSGAINTRLSNNELTFGNTNGLHFSIQPQKYKNTDNEYISDFVWTVPSGWQIYDNDGEDVYIIPNACDGGEVSVKAKSECGNFYSNKKTVTITRIKPTTFEITSSDESIAVCGRTQAFSISATPITGATYIWHLPPGWQASNNNSTTYISPNGQNGGEVSVTAYYCSQTSTSDPINFDFKYSDPDNPPSIAGSDFFCNSTNVTYTVANAENGWNSYNWTKESVLSYVSGQGTANYTIRSNNTVNYQSWVDVTINTGCDNHTINLNRKNVWVGLPNYVDLHVRDYYTKAWYPYLCQNQSNYVEVFSMGSSMQNIDQYQWGYASGGSVYAQPPSPYDVATIYPYSSYISFSIKAHNQCGWTQYKSFGLSAGYCGYYSYSVYPNPTSTELNVELDLDQERIIESNVLRNEDISNLNISKDSKVENKVFEISLFNKDGKLLRHSYTVDLKSKLDVSKLPEDIYILRISDGETTEEQKIIISK